MSRPSLGCAAAAGLLALSLCPGSPAFADQATDTALSKIETTIRTMMLTERPGKDGLIEVWDGNKYVQCRRLADRTLHCEAAGSLMQTSLAGILTPDRDQRLTGLGWQIDPSFGNYAQTIPASWPPGRTAHLLLETLVEGYGAAVSALELKNVWIASEPCPPRNGQSQNLAGLINDAPEMAATSIHACAYQAAAAAAQPPPPLEPSQPLGTAQDVIRVYGAGMTSEIDRLRTYVGTRWIFMIVDAGRAGDVQCEATDVRGELNCEAASADSAPDLAATLTPDRVARLHAAGFADPGRTQNYARTYKVGDASSAAIANALLTILHYVYGYNGSPRLSLETETGKHRPL